MINRHAVFHKPLSNYAFAIDEKNLKIRIRVARDNLLKIRLHYGDTAYPAEIVKFHSIEMKSILKDNYFDYYEALIKNSFKRVVYYFELIAVDEIKYYYTDFFYDNISFLRNDFYKFPYIRKEDVVDAPNWIKDAVIYNIFPDSFVDNFHDKNLTIKHQGNIIRGRLGGNLNSIYQKIDYIKDLGFNVIYLNPIFTGGEYHKYDVINYYEIDPLFGTNKDFKNLVETCHEKNIRVIIDGVFNHSGWNFFAFKDVLKNQEKSKYKDWFYRLEFPVVIPENDSKTPNYECFGYEKRMPKLNTSNPEVISYFMDVCAYWIREYDIDGWRLDVADEVNTDFWRQFRKTAKSIKSDCVLIGEVWQDASYFLDGSMFDSTMNYDFLKHAKDFFSNNSIDAYDFDGRITNMLVRYRENMNYCQLNLLDSHDVPRFLSLLQGDINRYRLAIIFLFTSIGAPSVFYGDEQGLEGIKELDYRKSMDFSKNESLHSFFKKIISLRNENIVLRRGYYQTLIAEKKSKLFAYKRFYNNESIEIYLNNSSEQVFIPHTIIKDWIIDDFNYNENRLDSFGYLILRKGVK